MTEGIQTHVPEEYVHPKHCPQCTKIWELDSQMKHKCCYCGWLFRPRQHGIIAMLLPTAMWLLAGIVLLLMLGKHYNG